MIAHAAIDTNNKLTVTFNDHMATHTATGRGAITITAPLNYVAKRDHGYTTIDLGGFGTHKLKVKPARPSEPEPLADSAEKAEEKLVVDSPEIKHVMNSVPLTGIADSTESTTPTSTPGAQPQGWPDDELADPNTEGLLDWAENPIDEEPWNDFGVRRGMGVSRRRASRRFLSS